MITARYHREIPQRFRLEAARCTKCGQVSFPPRQICPQCKGRTFEAVRLSEEGKIVTFTVLRVASDRLSKQTPFAVAVVELNDGVRITTQIADADVDKLEVGQSVKFVFRRVQEDGRAGILCYGYKAVIV